MLFFPDQVENRRKAFLEWKSIDFSPKLSLTCVGIMLTIIKELIILFLLCLWEQGTPWQFSKQITKLSSQFSVQVYSLLGQTEEEWRAFYGGCKKGVPIVRLPSRALGCNNIRDCFSFRFGINLQCHQTAPLYFF